MFLCEPDVSGMQEETSVFCLLSKSVYNHPRWQRCPAVWLSRRWMEDGLRNQRVDCRETSLPQQCEHGLASQDEDLLGDLFP